jgi:hypothetical protein
MRIGALLLMAMLGLAACGGGDEPSAKVPCVDDDPGQAVAYANADVAIGRDPDADRSEGALPWFAKTALFVRGDRQVVVRVPDELSGEVGIVGWGQAGGEPRDVALVEPACARVWTAYPGGLAFRGRHCVRLRVEGPGEARGSVLVGLRRDC